MEVKQSGHWKDLVVSDTKASLKLDQCTKAWPALHKGQHWSILRPFRFILNVQIMKLLLIQHVKIPFACSKIRSKIYIKLGNFPFLMTPVGLDKVCEKALASIAP